MRGTFVLKLLAWGIAITLVALPIDSPRPCRNVPSATLMRQWAVESTLEVPATGALGETCRVQMRWPV